MRLKSGFRNGDAIARFEDELATMITRWRLESEARPDSHLWRACAQTTITPVFTAASLRDELGCPTTAATETIERLGRIGIVAQVSLAQRNRVYLNRAVLRARVDDEHLEASLRRRLAVVAVQHACEHAVVAQR